jgi:hypothetical protein
MNCESLPIIRHKTTVGILLSLLLSVFQTYAQTGNHVFSGAEAGNFGIVDLATPGGQSWSTDRAALPGYFSAIGTASYTSPSDSKANVDGYVKHYATAANQPFSYPVGTGADYRELAISGTIPATSEIGVAWIVGDPSLNQDPTSQGAPAGAHPIASVGTGIQSVSPVGQWDWQDLSNNAAGTTVTVSIPDMTSFSTAPNLRLVGWNGSQWVNLSGTTGASGNAENSTLAGTMISGITAIGIGVAAPTCLAGNVAPAVN